MGVRRTWYGAPINVRPLPGGAREIGQGAGTDVGRAGWAVLLALLLAGCGLLGDDELRAGSCLQRGETDEDGRTSMTVTACDRPHDVEVISLLHADELDGDFPGDDALSRWAFQQCIDAFEEYVGEAYGRSTLEIDIAAPTETQWEDGRRDVRCGVISLDGKPLTSSVAS